jgi:hypothetical protein
MRDLAQILAQEAEIEISELPELPSRGQLNLSEPINHTAIYRCYLTLIENLHKT